MQDLAKLLKIDSGVLKLTYIDNNAHHEIAWDGTAQLVKTLNPAILYIKRKEPSQKRLKFNALSPIYGNSETLFYVIEIFQDGDGGNHNSIIMKGKANIELGHVKKILTRFNSINSNKTQMFHDNKELKNAHTVADLGFNLFEITKLTLKKDIDSKIKCLAGFT